ncbi:hypothetical protein [Amycolatopsis sp. NPDC059657]|uniref:hypothetical protein n=1 Tax=Amycolatopsis sp. NPDC059657 TaxID=3346899 RepID=UPI00366ECFB5
MRMKKIFSVVLSTMAAASLTLVATSPSEAATKAARDTCPDEYLGVKVYYDKARWSVYADLYDGNGKNVDHWQATSKKGLGEVSWRFGNCGDGGWAHIWIDVPGQRFHEFFMPRTRGHCFSITNNGTQHIVARCTI